MKLEHSYTVPHNCDAQNITESDIRSITRSHYDFIRWCDDNATGACVIEKTYNPDGITLWFEHEEDHLNFLDHISNCYWEFFYD